MARTKDETLREITETYLQGLNQAKPPGPETIQADILDATQLNFQLENQNRPKGSLWKIPDRLVAAQIALIMMKLYSRAKPSSAIAANTDDQPAA